MFDSQPLEMYLIYVALDIGTLYFGEYKLSSGENRDYKDSGAYEHSLVIHRSDVPKLNQAFKEMRSQKYELYL